MKINRLVAIILFYACFSCEKQVVVDDINFNPHIVVNSFFQRDSCFSIHISNSGSVFDINNSAAIIPDAEVSLYENGIFTEKLHSGIDGLYYSETTLAKQGISYKVEVTSSGNTVFASDIIPAENKLIKTEFIHNAGFTSLNDRYHKLILQFEDHPEEKNFYEIILKFDYLDSLPILGKLNGISNVYSYDAVIKNEIDVRDFGFNIKSLVFSDELFDGQTYSLPLHFFNIGGDDNNTPFKLVICFNTISENYYRYKKKLHLYGEFELTDIWEDSREPVILFSNVEKGYGIFAGFNSNIDTIYSNLQ